MQKNRSQKYSLILIVGLIFCSLFNFFSKLRNLENQHSKTIIANFTPWQIPRTCRFQLAAGWDFVLPSCDALSIGETYTIIGTANTVIDNQIIWENNIEISNFYLNRDHKYSFFNRLNASKVFFLEKINLCRTYLLSQLQALFSGHNYQFLAALTLGTAAFDFNYDLKQQVRQVGLSHMTAVSGFHLGVIASILAILSELILPKNKAKNIVLPGVLFYVFLVGSPLSMVRACLMLCFSFIGRNFFYKQTSSLLTLFFAFILMFNKMILNIFNVGFLLSFAATLGIILFANNFTTLTAVKTQLIAALNRTKPLSSWQKRLFSLWFALKGMILVSLAAQILTLPISLVVFQEYAPSSILSTLLFSSLIVLIVSLGVILLILLLFNLWWKFIWQWFVLPLALYLELLLTFFNQFFAFYSSMFAGLIRINFQIEQQWLYVYYFSVFLLFLALKVILKKRRPITTYV
ncbi:MAG: ComEC/Rec2 family competence protein [bacterium]|nr:ComEC/Rec2 family competence protein [bacterium]